MAPRGRRGRPAWSEFLVKLIELGLSAMEQQREEGETPAERIEKAIQEKLGKRRTIKRKIAGIEVELIPL